MASFYGKVVIATASISALVFVAPALAEGKKGGGKKSGNHSTPAPTPTPTPPPTSTTVTDDLNEVTADRIALTKATKDVDDATAKLIAEFEATPEYVAAKKAADDAMAVTQSARAAVLEKLKTDPAYKGKQADEAAARTSLEAMRENGSDKDAIANKAAEVLNLSNAVGRMEQDALAADAIYKDADAKSTAASTALSVMLSKFRETLKTDPRLADVHKARDDAQAKLNAAQTKLATDRGY